MAEKKIKPVDTRIKQTRQGYAVPRRIRELRVGPGNVVGGWSIDTNGAFTSDTDANGFRIILDSAADEISFDAGVSIRNTATPFSGVGGMAIEHGDGVVMVDVSGDGDGLGSQQVLLRNANSSVYIGIQRDLSGTTRIIMGGLRETGHRRHGWRIGHADLHSERVTAAGSFRRCSRHRSVLRQRRQRRVCVR